MSRKHRRTGCPPVRSRTPGTAPHEENRLPEPGTEPEEGGRIGIRAGWEDLARAVVLQAVRDYRVAQRRLKRPRTRDMAEKELRSLEHFFRSHYGSILMQADGKALLGRLKAEPAGSPKKGEGVRYLRAQALTAGRNEERRKRE